MNALCNVSHKLASILFFEPYPVCFCLHVSVSQTDWDLSLLLQKKEAFKCHSRSLFLPREAIEFNQTLIGNRSEEVHIKILVRSFWYQDATGFFFLRSKVRLWELAPVFSGLCSFPICLEPTLSCLRHVPCPEIKN